jgi:hypothetical protein
VLVHVWPDAKQEVMHIATDVAPAPPAAPVPLPAHGAPAGGGGNAAHALGTGTVGTGAGMGGIGGTGLGTGAGVGMPPRQVSMAFVSAVQPLTVTEPLPWHRTPFFSTHAMKASSWELHSGYIIRCSSQLWAHVGSAFGHCSRTMVQTEAHAPVVG